MYSLPSTSSSRAPAAVAKVEWQRGLYTKGAAHAARQRSPRAFEVVARFGPVLDHGLPVSTLRRIIGPMFTLAKSANGALILLASLSVLALRAQPYRAHPKRSRLVAEIFGSTCRTRSHSHGLVGILVCYSRDLPYEWAGVHMSKRTPVSSQSAGPGGARWGELALVNY
jgi:hypothetical protein